MFLWGLIWDAAVNFVKTKLCCCFYKQTAKEIADAKKSYFQAALDD